MNLTRTHVVLFLLLVVLSLGAAACTQAKPAVPTPTLVPLNTTPVLPLSGNETPGAIATAAPAVPGITVVPQGGLTPAPNPAATVPPLLPTPTIGVLVVPPASDTPTPGSSTDGATTTTGACTNPYIIQPGEHIYQIARKCGVSAQAIIAANPGTNPNFVRPGQTINMPSDGSVPPGSGVPSTGGHTYIVRAGDNLFRIALRYGTTVYMLMQLNGLSNPNYLYVGQVLSVP